ncbi:hypothetical protein PLESTM_001770600 [Pleodorina starrii]|nr:hypothetical protein PLESTM_001770600 [Pleodorina starrii]
MLSSGQHYYFPTNLFDHWGRSKAPSNATRRSCNICRKALKEVVEYNEQQQQEQAPPVPAQQQQQLALGLGAADARVVGGAAAGNSMGAKPAENGIARRGVRDKKQNRRYID